MYQWDISNYKEESINNGLLCMKGVGYKMNAFPLSFKGRCSVMWGEETKKLIGLHSFEVYREWCIQERGKFFQNLASSHLPKLIVCTGITSTMEFIRFFGCNLETYREVNGINIASSNEGKTLVIIVPFFGGPYGINRVIKKWNL